MLTHHFRHVPCHRSIALAAALALTAAAFFVLLAADIAGAADERVWVRHYAASSGSDTWRFMAKGPSGTVYVAGWRKAEAPDQRLMVAKYTAGGRRVWVRSFFGRNGAWPTGLAVDSRGRAYVVGGERYEGTVDSHVCLLKLASRAPARRVAAALRRPRDAPPGFRPTPPLHLRIPLRCGSRARGHGARVGIRRPVVYHRRSLWRYSCSLQTG